MTTAETNIQTDLLQEIFDWAEGPLHPAGAEISGKSLKYIRSALPVIIFQMDDEGFQDLHNQLVHSKHEQNESLKIIASEKEIKFQTGTNGNKFHYIYRPESALHTKEEIKISTDFLIRGLNSPWKGSPQSLKDLDEHKITILNREEFSCRDILQICSLHSMLDIEPEESLIFKLRNNFFPEDYQTLNRRFLNKIIKKIVTGAKPSHAFIALEKIGALDYFLPELARGRGLSQNRYHKYDVFMHSIYTCDAVPEPDLVLRLSALFHDLGKVETRKVKTDGEASFHNHEMVSTRHTDRILKRFGFDADLIKHVKFLVRNHMFHYTSEWSDKAIRRFMNRVGPDDMEDLIRLRLADRTGSGKRTSLPKAIKDLMRHIEEVRAREAEFKIKDLALNGYILQDMGVSPGPDMGKILQELHRLVVEENFPNEESILHKEAEKIIQQIPLKT